MMDAKIFFNDIYKSQDQPSDLLKAFQQKNWNSFSELDLPSIKHEEWKYTRIKNIFTEAIQYNLGKSDFSKEELAKGILPGTSNANSLVFINGIYQSHRSQLTDASEKWYIKTLNEASTDEDAQFVKEYLGCSNAYHPDGINALNGSFAANGLFIKVKKGKHLSEPIVIYHFSDSRSGFRFSQPRILVSIEENATATLIETYHKIGNHQSLTNEVVEICVEKDAHFRYIKIQNEGADSNHTGTTQINQLGKSTAHAVTISLNGEIVRNNLNMVMRAEFCESHMYGLYLLGGKSQVDNHTIVDNAMPNCLSNELYKGIMDDSSTGIFNGKIFVRKDAQKTNAYQSNKNILLGQNSSANTKPQLEIFADDVKCSHGCTIGKLDEDALFYLRARGISEQNAKALLLHAFAADILQQIELEELRNYIDSLISERLTLTI